METSKFTEQITDRIISLIEQHGFTTDIEGAPLQLKMDIKRELDLSFSEAEGEIFEWIGIEQEPISRGPY